MTRAMMMLLWLTGLLFLRPVYASHWHDPGSQTDKEMILNATEYGNGGITAYLRAVLDDHETARKDPEFDIDFPSCLFHYWVSDAASQSLMDCDFTETCEASRFEDVVIKPGEQFDDPQEILRWRHTIFQQRANFHHVQNDLARYSAMHQASLSSELASLSKTVSWADEMDAWHVADERRRTMVAHMIMSVALIMLPLMAAPAGIMDIGAVEAATAAGVVGGAWAGATSLVVDGMPKDEHAHDDLVEDAGYWLGQTSTAMRATNEFNTRHLFNGGKLGNHYSIADYLQFGGFLETDDSIDLGEMVLSQQRSMIVDRVWKKDRAYIVTRWVDRCDVNVLQLTREKNGGPVWDSKIVCLPAYPQIAFYVYTAPMDPDAVNPNVPDWYPDTDQDAKAVPGKGSFDSVWHGITWEDVVRSSTNSWKWQNNDNQTLFNEAMNYQNERSSSFVFTLPICQYPSLKAVGSHDIHRMPGGMPARCYEDTLRFLRAQGIPSSFDRKKAPPSGMVSISVGMGGTMEGLLKCSHHRDGDIRFERCTNHSDHAITIPAEPPAPCGGVHIPMDAVYEVPTAVMGMDGCPRLGDAGQVIPLDLDDFRARSGWKGNK